MKISFPNISDFIGNKTLEKAKQIAIDNLEMLLNRTGKGNDFLGWIDLPEKTESRDYEKIKKCSDKFRNLDAVVVIGIGGSYLGAKAIIEALKPQFNKTQPEILFAGQNLSTDYHTELLEYVKDKEFGIVVISKSGTTIEPAIAFRLFYNLMKEKYDKETIKNRVVAITDAKSGALRILADQEGFESFVIDDNVGGRFSVLSSVGLLPVAIAGFDINKIIAGAADAKQHCTIKSENNPAVLYAGIRNVLYASGHKIELMVNYDLRLSSFSEWWKQLYGESEGKENKGIFPASVSYTTDLHSLGQYVQQGERTLFETVIYAKSPAKKLKIPYDENNLDNLNYLSGKDVEYVNRNAAEGTLLAHLEGKVPNICIEIDKIDEYSLGYLIYFFEIACGISAYILNVNPFDQPGVEDYKKNMFRLLGKK